jgi:hypothetical protein
MTTTVVLDEEQRADRFTELVERLSHQSVVKHFDAYADVAWDDPAYQIDPADPRWELERDHGLGATEWYRSQPPEVRARIGLHSIAANMKAGLQFESILKRGLLEYAFLLPDHSPEFRYAYHEVIEEAQHSLMFQEFVNRTGYDAPGLAWYDRWSSRWIIGLGRRFPALLFLFVLGGEDPIDYVQRRELRSDREKHPLLERIIRIHVTEEARHLSFARHYLKRTVPRLSRARRMQLAVGAPLILGAMAQLMLKPSADLVKRYSIPAEVVAAAYDNNPRHRAETIASLGKVRKLCEDLGLVRRPYTVLWRKLGLQ